MYVACIRASCVDQTTARVYRHHLVRPVQIAGTLDLSLNDVCTRQKQRRLRQMRGFLQDGSAYSQFKLEYRLLGLSGVGYPLVLLDRLHHPPHSYVTLGLLMNDAECLGLEVSKWLHRTCLISQTGHWSLSSPPHECLCCSSYRS